MTGPVVVSIDGVLVDPAAAVISVFDRGLLYGDGVFEVLRTWGGIAVELEAHLDRLYAAVAALGLRALDRATLAGSIEEAIAAAGPGEHRIRVVVTRGAGSLAATTAELGPGRAIVVVEPLGTIATALSAAVVDWPLPRRAAPAWKTLAYLDHVIARDLARAAGADEALRLDADGRVVEGATSNLFAVIDGVVVTAPLEVGVLPGIVRARLLALCARSRIRSQVSSLAVADLQIASELFLSSSLRGVVPITRLDGIPRDPGPITAQLAVAYLAELVGLGSSRAAGRQRRDG